jgi:hypothetical protein
MLFCREDRIAFGHPLEGGLKQISLEGFAFLGFFSRSLLKSSFQLSRVKKPWLSPRLIYIVGKTGFPACRQAGNLRLNPIKKASTFVLASSLSGRQDSLPAGRQGTCN